MWSVRLCLPFSDCVQPLQDILENIERIERFLHSKGPRESLMTERCSHASMPADCSEAAKRLGSEVLSACGT